MTCDTWFEKLKLESNTTLRFLTLCAGSEGGVVYDFWEPMRINSVLSGLSFNLFE